MSTISMGVTVSGTCDGTCQFVLYKDTLQRKKCGKKVDGGDGVQFCGHHTVEKRKAREEKKKGKAVHVPCETSDVEESDEEVSQEITSTLDNKMAACKVTTHEHVEACDDDKLDFMKYGLCDQPDEDIDDNLKDEWGNWPSHWDECGPFEWEEFRKSGPWVIMSAFNEEKSCRRNVQAKLMATMAKVASMEKELAELRLFKAEFKQWSSHFRVTTSMSNEVKGVEAQASSSEIVPIDDLC